MSAGEWNDVLVLALTVCGIVGAWIRWGQKRWDAWHGARKERRERFDLMLGDYQSFREEVSSIRESSTRHTGQMRLMDDRLTNQDKMLDGIAANQWAAMRFDMQPRFQCDHKGCNQQVSDSYAKLMRCGERDLLEYDWKNFILEEDRAQYERDAAQAFREHRRFERTVRFRRSDGSEFLGRVRIEPYPEDPGDITEGNHAVWFGSIILVEELA